MAALSLLGDEKTMLINDKYDSLEIPCVSSMASTALLSEGEHFRHQIQVSASTTYQGTVLQDIICNFFNYKVISVFASNDYFGQKFVYELTEGSVCSLNVIRVHQISGSSGIAEELAQAKKDGSRVFVIALSPDHETETATLLETGHAIGLFGEGSQIIGTSTSFDNLRPAHFSVGADVKALLKGVVYTQYDPLRMITEPDEGKDFIARWRAQEATQWNSSAGVTECTQTRDGDDFSYFYRDQGYSDLTDFKCAGLNYSSFAVDGSDLAPYLGHAYDAAVTLLRSVSDLVDSHGENYDGEDILDVILSQSKFDGVTGEVDIFEGLALLHKV